MYILCFNIATQIYKKIYSYNRAKAPKCSNAVAFKQHPCCLKSDIGWTLARLNGQDPGMQPEHWRIGTLLNYVSHNKLSY
jgi:hypothetical protein